MVFLSGLLFFRTPHETLKFQENPRKCFFQQTRPKFQIFPLQCLLWGHPTQPLNYVHCKETDSLGENGCRQKWLDKSLLAYNFTNFIEKSIDNLFFSYLAMITSTLGRIQADGHLNNWKFSKPPNFANCWIVVKLKWCKNS